MENEYTGIQQVPNARDRNEPTIMISTDRKGKSVAQGSIDKSKPPSLTNRLNRVMSEVVHGKLDIDRPIFVQLEEDEKTMLIEAFKGCRVGHEFIPEAEPDRMKEALRIVSDPINNNPRNGVGMFIPTIATVVTGDVKDVKVAYGWTYVACPSSMTLWDGVRIHFRV